MVRRTSEYWKGDSDGLVVDDKAVNNTVFLRIKMFAKRLRKNLSGITNQNTSQGVAK
jgi:hypothetical protein